MPEAVSSDSIPAPKDQHPNQMNSISLEQALDDLSDLIGLMNVLRHVPSEDIERYLRLIREMLNKQHQRLTTVVKFFGIGASEHDLAARIEAIVGASEPLILSLPNLETQGSITSPALRLIDKMKSEFNAAGQRGHQRPGLATPTYPIVKEAIANIAERCRVSESSLIHVIIVQWLLDIGKLSDDSCYYTEQEAAE
jgi:hypothetical protein